MGLRALKLLQWTIRAVQFCCAGLVFSIYSYYLATLNNHGLAIATWIRAVEGISGFAVLYISAQLVLLCFVAGYPLTSFLAMVFDFAFLAAFIYVAQANRGGAGSCTGHVDTPFGSGDSDKVVADNGHGGFTSLPSLHQACQLESACLAVSILIIFFFIFSMVTEWRLGRQRNKDRRGLVPMGEHIDDTGSKHHTGGFFGFLRRRATRKDYDNILPEHTHPDQLEAGRAQGADSLPVTQEPRPAITPVSSGALATTSPITPTSPAYNRYAGYDNYRRESSPYARVDTEYSNGAAPVSNPSPVHPYAPNATHGAYHPPPAQSPERVQFPAGNYHYADTIYDRA